MPHRPGPRAQHPVGRGVARLQDPERRDQLRLEKPPAPPLPSQRRGCRDHGNVAQPCAEPRLQPPDGGDDIGIDPALRLDRRQGRTLWSDAGPPQRKVLIRSDQCEVILGRTAEFRLVPVAVDDAWQEALAAKAAVERGLRDALRQRSRPKGRDPSVVICIGLRAEIGVRAGTGRAYAPRTAADRRHAASQRRRGSARQDRPACPACHLRRSLPDLAQC